MPPARSCGSIGVVAGWYLVNPSVRFDSKTRSDSLTDTVSSNVSRLGPNLHPGFVYEEIEFDKLWAFELVCLNKSKDVEQSRKLQSRFRRRGNASES